MKQLFLSLFFLSISSGCLAQTPVCTPTGYRLIDDDGDFLDKAPRTYIDNTHPKYFLSYKNGSFSYINAYGKSMFPVDFSIAYPFYGDFALAQRNGKFYHLSSEGLFIDTLEHPLKPMVHDKSVLISLEKKKIWHSSGELLRTFEDSIIISDHSGMFLWNREDQTAEQFTTSYGRSKLNKIKEYKNVTKVDNTQQGYVVIVQQKGKDQLFSVMDKNGQAILANQPDINYYKTLRVIQQNYVFVSDKGAPMRIQNPWEFNMWWPMQYLKSDRNRINNGSLCLSNRKELSRFGVLLGTEKYVSFDNGVVQGNYLFDRILPTNSRSGKYPVKMKQKWYLYQPNKELLEPLPYKEIHPMGIKNEVMLVSDTIGDNPTKNWAVYSFKTDKKTNEEFVLKRQSLELFKLYQDLITDPWFNDVMKLSFNDRACYFSEQGKLIFTEEEDVPTFELKDFYTCTLRVNVRVFKDIPKGVKSKKGIEVQVNQNNGLTVKVINNAKEELPIEFQDGLFQMSLQFETKPGKWKTVAGPPQVTCGNSYYMGKFPAKKMVVQRLALPPGSSYVNVRMALEIQGQEQVYSNVIRYGLPSGFLQGYYPPYGIPSQVLLPLYKRKL